MKTGSSLAGSPVAGILLLFLRTGIYQVLEGGFVAVWACLTTLCKLLCSAK